MSLLEAISLNVAKEKVKKVAKKILKAFAPENFEKLHKSLHQQMAARFSHRELTLIIDGFVTD